MTHPMLRAIVVGGLALWCLPQAGGGVTRLAGALTARAAADPDMAQSLEPLAEPTPPPTGRVIEIDRAADGLFYTEARIDGRAIRLLVDTGATTTTLTAADAHRLHLAPGAAARLRTANGVTGATATRITRVDVEGRSVAGVDALVVARGLPVSLLGQDLLARLGPVHIEGDRLRIG